MARGQRRQVVVPVAIRHRAIFHAARARQHLEADEGGFGGEHFVLVAQEGADDVGHDAFRAAARDDVLHLEVELAAPAPRAGRARRWDRDSARRATRVMASTALGDGAQRILVRRQLGDAREAVLLADGFDGAPRLVRPQRFDIWRNQWHRFYFTGPARRLVRRTAAYGKTTGTFEGRCADLPCSRHRLAPTAPPGSFSPGRSFRRDVESS